MILSLNRYEKTGLKKNTKNDTWIIVHAEQFILRTGDHFTRYSQKKSLKIEKNIQFQIYNISDYPISIEINQDIYSQIIDVEDNLLPNNKNIYTIYRGVSKRIIDSFEIFSNYYKKNGYNIFTFDTDHTLFNRAAARNTAAMVCPDDILCIIDSDVFISDKNLQKTIRVALSTDMLCKPSIYSIKGDLHNNNIEDLLVKINSLDLQDNKNIESFCNENYFIFSTYHGYAYIQKTSSWLGMDERLNEYGFEDALYLEICKRLYEQDMIIADNDLIIFSTHGGSDFELDRINEYKLSLLAYKDLTNNFLIEMLKKECLYGRYGKFIGK